MRIDCKKPSVCAFQRSYKLRGSYANLFVVKLKPVLVRVVQEQVHGQKFFVAEQFL